MTDTELIQELRELPNCNPTLSSAYLIDRKDIDEVISRYEEPSYATEPKISNGMHWIITSPDSYGRNKMCPECKFLSDRKYNYCPRCGVRLRVNSPVFE